MDEADERWNRDLSYVLALLEEMDGFNNLNFFSSKRKRLYETNPEILVDFIEEIYNYLPNHMREKYHRLAILTLFILGAGNEPGREADYLRVSRESIDEVRGSPKQLDLKRIRELDPHFADLVGLAKENVVALNESLNRAQPLERYRIDSDDMWDLMEKLIKAYWIENRKAKRIAEGD